MCIKCRNKQLLISLQFPHHILLTAIYCIACRMRITNFKSNSNHRLKTSVRPRTIINLGQRGQRLRVDKIKNEEWPERLLYFLRLRLVCFLQINCNWFSFPFTQENFGNYFIFILWKVHSIINNFYGKTNL